MKKNVIAVAAWAAVGSLIFIIWWRMENTPHHDNELFGAVGDAMQDANYKVYGAESRGDWADAHARLEHLRRWASTIADKRMRNAILYNIHIHEGVLADDERDAKLKGSIPIPPPYLVDKSK